MPNDFRQGVPEIPHPLTRRGQKCNAFSHGRDWRGGTQTAIFSYSSTFSVSAHLHLFPPTGVFPSVSCASPLTTLGYRMALLFVLLLLDPLELGLFFVELIDIAVLQSISVLKIQMEI